jgi:hypothetical protein
MQTAKCFYKKNCLKNTFETASSFLLYTAETDRSNRLFLRENSPGSRIDAYTQLGLGFATI